MPASRTTSWDTAEKRSRANTVRSRASTIARSRANSKADTNAYVALDDPLLDADYANFKARPGWQWLVFNYNHVTNICINVSAFFFFPCNFPQIYKKYINLAACNLQPFDALAWQAYGMGGLGDLCMSTYFASQNEWAAVRFQVFGTSTSWVVLYQMCMAGKTPFPALVGLSVVYGMGLLMAATKACGICPEKVFTTWQEFTTPIGMGACCFSFMDSFIFPHDDPADTNPISMYVGAAGFVFMLVVCLVRPAKLMPIMGSVSAWLATFLFMFMPIAQILAVYKEIDNPEAVSKGFSLLAAILGAIGNGLGSVRAFHTKDAIWYIGAMWGCLLGGWGCSVVVWMANALDTHILAALTAFLVFWFSFIIKLNGDAHDETLCQQFAFVGNACSSGDEPVDEPLAVDEPQLGA